MVAQKVTGSAAPFRDLPRSPARTRTHVQRLLGSISRLGALQARLLLLRGKLELRKLLVYLALLTGVMMAGVAGVVFGLIALFKLVDWAWQQAVTPLWANILTYAVFTIVFLGGAVGLWFWAQRAWARPQPGTAEPAPEETPGEDLV